MSKKLNSITTLNEISSVFPFMFEGEYLLEHLGKTRVDDEPLPLLTILDINGFDFALWCLGVPSLDRLSMQFQLECLSHALDIYWSERQVPFLDSQICHNIRIIRNYIRNGYNREDTAPKAIATSYVAELEASWVSKRNIRAEQEAILREMIDKQSAIRKKTFATCGGV